MTSPATTLRLPATSASEVCTGPMVRSGIVVLDGLGVGLILGIALVAGLMGASVSSEVLARVGVAAVTAGAIALGLSAHLAARASAKRADARARDAHRLASRSRAEPQEVVGLLARYGITASESAPIVTAFCRRPAAWREFAAHFERSGTDAMRSSTHAFIVIAACLTGGLAPLLPHAFGAATAVPASIGVTVSSLLAVGYVSARSAGAHPLAGATRMATVGVLAAAAAYAIAHNV